MAASGFQGSAGQGGYLRKSIPSAPKLIKIRIDKPLALLFNGGRNSTHETSHDMCNTNCNPAMQPRNRAVGLTRFDGHLGGAVRMGVLV
jgi:hypothetical protein